MSRLETALRAIAAALADLHAHAALVGGLAVSARVEPRFTRDLDLAVAVADDPEAESLVRTLSTRGWRPVVTVEQTSAGRLATVRLAPPAEPDQTGVVVDLLFASSGIEPEVVAEAEPLEIFPSCTLPVARVGHLVALKLLARDDARRPQDAADLRALRPLLDTAERQRAGDAVRAIEQRGFSRGRDLRAALAALLVDDAS